MKKICTDLEQSKKLLELGIDIYTADMYWKNGVSDKYIQCFTPFVSSGTDIDYDYDIPAWSLTVLMKLMPKVSTDGDEIYESYPIMEHDDEGFAVSSPIYNTSYYSEPIDAAFEMVCWLKENGKI